MRRYMIGAITAALLAGFGLSNTADAARFRVNVGGPRWGVSYRGNYRPYYRNSYRPYYRPYYYNNYGYGYRPYYNYNPGYVYYTW